MILGSSLTNARKNGWKWYYTGRPCRRGHVSPRLASSGRCKTCHEEHKRAFRKTEKHKRWKRKYDTEYNRKNLTRKEMQRRATPKGYAVERIKEFYTLCPINHHVDHIIPLNGTNVCGLHVLENLQYLPAGENLKKGNNMPDDVTIFPTCPIKI